MSNIEQDINTIKIKAGTKVTEGDKAEKRGDHKEALVHYETALLLYEEGIQLLEKELKKFQGNQTLEDASQVEYRNKMARELANFYGMAGGTLRRKKDFEGSIKKYEKGYSIESKKIYNIQDSYNLTNRIVVRIIAEPDSLFDQESAIRKGIDTIGKQLQGVRRLEWWAWADYGELNLLIGDKKKAHYAYEKFTERKPNRKNYESAIAVLKDLCNALKKSAASITKLINEEIEFLEKNKPPEN